jgi:NAD-dependent dihydropyrimidine dehydrogenase PreA subunit
MIKIDVDLCDLCGTCVGICPADCLELSEQVLSVNQSICTSCGKCVIICPMAALTHAEGRG